MQENVKGSTEDPRVLAWEEKVITAINNFRDERESSILEPYPYGLWANRDAAGGAILRDVRKLAVGYILVAVFMNIFLWRRNIIYSQTALTYASLVAVGLAVAAAFGLVLSTGTKFSGVVNFLAFLLLGLGVDDTFVIINAHRDTYHPSKSSRNSNIDAWTVAVMAHDERPQLVKSCSDAPFDPAVPSSSSDIVGRALAERSLSKLGRWFVLAISAGLLAFGIVGASRAKIDFQYERWFTPNGHPIQTYLDIRDEYFSGGAIRITIYTREPEAPDTYFTLQHELVAVYDALQQEEYVSAAETRANISRSYPIQTWYHSYSAWLLMNYADELNSDGQLTSEERFLELLEVFLATDGRSFEGSIKWNDDRSKIIATQMTAFATSQLQRGGLQSVRAMDGIVEAVTEAGPKLDAIPYQYVRQPIRMGYFPHIDVVECAARGSGSVAGVSATFGESTCGSTGTIRQGAGALMRGAD
eukprot:scaffold201_cov405-Prasinococcus_capsulatus_cf.AAC.35